MIQNVLRDIGGIGLYGVISVCLFFLVFSVALVRACLLKKPFLKSMGALPLEDGARPTSSRGSDSGDWRTPATLPAGTKGISNHE